MTMIDTKRKNKLAAKNDHVKNKKTAKRMNSKNPSPAAAAGTSDAAGGGIGGVNLDEIDEELLRSTAGSTVGETINCSISRFIRQGDMEFNLGNYTSEDMTSLTMITEEMNRRMELSRGMKRGRKVQGFAVYC